MIKVTVKGNTRHMETFLQRMKRREQFKVLSKYGTVGVEALRRTTPIDEGATADGWYYEIVDKPGYFAIHWLNSNLVEPGTIPVAVLVQYGHATGNGGYVQGRDYINPAMRPIFDEMVNAMWKEVTR